MEADRLEDISGSILPRFLSLCLEPKRRLFSLIKSYHLVKMAGQEQGQLSVLVFGSLGTF